MKQTPLGPRPDKVREWLQKNRQPLQRRPFKVRARVPTDVRNEVIRRQYGRCLVCGRLKIGLQVHHVLPQRIWPEHVFEPRNLVALCPGCHDNHERAHRRIRFDELPDETTTWINTLGGQETGYLERTYRA